MRRARIPGWPYPALRTLNLCPATPLVDANGDAIDEAHVDRAALYALANSSYSSYSSSISAASRHCAVVAKLKDPNCGAFCDFDSTLLAADRRSLLPALIPGLHSAVDAVVALNVVLQGFTDVRQQWGALNAWPMHQLLALENLPANVVCRGRDSTGDGGASALADWL